MNRPHSTHSSESSVTNLMYHTLNLLIFITHNKKPTGSNVMKPRILDTTLADDTEEPFQTPPEVSPMAIYHATEPPNLIP